MRGVDAQTADLAKWVISFVAAALVCCLVFCRLRKRGRHQGKKQPPGPWALPLVGNLGISNTVALYRRCVEWGKVYGPIFRIKIGATNVVILSDVKIWKEFVAMEESLIRPHQSVVYQACRGYLGIATLNGKAWADNRRFCLRVLRDLGFGKTALEDHIKQQLQSLVNQIEDSKGTAIPIKECLFSISFNVISAVLFGSTYKESDHKHRNVKTHIMNLMGALATHSLVDFIPVWLSTVMSYVPFTEVANIRKTMVLPREFISARVMERRDTLEEDTNRDFIDGYLKQMMDQKDDPNSHYRECHLIGCAMDFFAAGVAGVPLAIHWLLLICAQNPHKVQSRIHAEIDRVVGREKQPAWKDRLAMPFTMACIWELLRWRKEGLLGFPRGVKEDILLEGFLIPKSTVVLPNTTAMNRDPHYWKRPDEYDPTRFLTPDGTELMKKPEYFIPFSFGKRMCPGESLATVQLFLYATCLMQKYCVLPEEGRQLPCLDPLVTDGNDPSVQKLRFVAR